MNQQAFALNGPTEGVFESAVNTFRPIAAIDTSNHSESFDADEPVSPTAIFRDALTQGQPHHDPMSVTPLQLANPIFEQQSAGSDDHYATAASFLHSSRVISPYPFFRPRSREADQDLLATGGMGWSTNQATTNNASLMMEETIDPSETQEQADRPIDYSLFFPSEIGDGNQAGGMDCDDFSISSHEAESIQDDDLLLCFEKISGDPASFWEEGMEESAGDNDSNRPRLVSQVSLSSSDSSSSRIRSLGKVPRRRPLQPATSP